MPAGLFLTFTAADVVSQFSTRLQYGHISSITMQLELVILEFWYDIGGPDGTQRFFLGAWLWIRNSEEVKEAGSLHRWDYRGERDSFSTGKWKVIGSSAHCQCALEECGGSFIPQLHTVQQFYSLIVTVDYIIRLFTWMLLLVGTCLLIMTNKFYLFI